MFSFAVKVHWPCQGLAPAVVSRLAGLRFLSGQPLLDSYWLTDNWDILWSWELCREVNSSSIFDQQRMATIAQSFWTPQHQLCRIAQGSVYKEIWCWRAADIKQHASLSSIHNNVIPCLISVVDVIIVTNHVTTWAIVSNLIYVCCLLSGWLANNVLRALVFLCTWRV